jgi:hypothetical protein
MAGDIFFTSQRSWSSNSIGFVDIMQRAISACADDEVALRDRFSHAEEIRSLDINLEPDRGFRLLLTERVLDVARTRLEELLADRASQVGEVRSIEHLVELARTHLAELKQERGGAAE